MSNTTWKDYNLPNDLIQFLQSGKQLEYDPKTCEPGLVELKKLEDLQLTEVVIEVDEQPHYLDDPNMEKRGFYYVSSVALVANCEAASFHPEEILLWYPEYKEFGQWDSEHKIAYRFSRRTWTHITQDPAMYLHSMWSEICGIAVRLLPWIENTGEFRERPLNKFLFE